MDTINIINNFDEKILKTNLLILNQKKLTELVINIFENDFADIDDNEMTLEYVREHLNKQNFINWELFLTLLNLKSTIQYEQHKNMTKIERTCNSLMYIIYYFVNQNMPNYKMIKFLLKMPSELICWDVHSQPFDSNILNILFYNYTGDDEIIDLLINNNSFNKLWTHANNKNQCCPLAYLLCYNKNISQIIQLFERKIIDINEKIMWNYKMFLPIVFFIYNENIKFIKHFIDFKVNLNDNSIYTQLGSCNKIEIFRILEDNGFDLMKKNDDNKLLFKIHDIKSIEILEYFLEKKYFELYEQIFLNSIENNHRTIVNKFITEGLIDFYQISNVDLILILLKYGYFKILMNMFHDTFGKIYSNVYNGMEYYYIEEKELLFDDNDEIKMTKLKHI